MHILDRMIFFEAELCDYRCQVSCFPAPVEDGKTFFLCRKLRPAEESLHERPSFDASASQNWVSFLVVVALLIAGCCCLCHQFSCATVVVELYEFTAAASNHNTGEPPNGDNPAAV